MTKTRIKISTILNNQLPSYVREEFPLVAEFLKQYYISQEFQGAPTDLLQNIDGYIKLNSIKDRSDSAFLANDISYSDETIFVSSDIGTAGFPDSYGLIKIDDEIITYKSKTSDSFTGCVRGFSGISSYKKENNPDEIIFESTLASPHSTVNSDGSKKTITNLSSLFLKEFFNKIKYQIAPGFEGRELYSELDQYLFLKQSKDFYSTKGTDTSFKILFKCLYGEDVKILKPQEHLIKPSDAHYKVSNDLIVETLEGNPFELENSTLFQDEYKNILSKGFASIAYIEKIFSISGKEYYRLSFDSGYNKDISVNGSLYGNFSIHPKTKLIGNTAAGSSTLNVDSTVGFPSEGDLIVEYEDGTSGIVSYFSKDLNQFFGCLNVEKNILSATDVSLNVFAYGTSNKTGETIKVRITSILNEIDIVDDTYYQVTGDTGIIRTLGVIPPKEDPTNNFIVNTSLILEVNSISLIDNINNVYQFSTFSNHHLHIGDFVKVIDSLGTENILSVEEVISDNTVYIGKGVELPLEFDYKIEKILTKVNHPLYPELSEQNANVQNVYKQRNRTLVSTPSLPFYNNQSLDSSDRSITFSLLLTESDFPEEDSTIETFQITSEKDHGFYSGDLIYYVPSSIGDSILQAGSYFIKRVNQYSIKFARSRSDIEKSKFITINKSLEVIDDKIVPYDLYAKSLKSQKLLREIIHPPINDGIERQTVPGPIGILINGTEILNYKSKDQLYYGSIKDIEVVSPGSDYDVLDPPVLDILDEVGFGATGYCSVRGSLIDIRLIDLGFDFVTKPQVVISGGNGTGANVSVSMKNINHQVSFDTEQKFNSINLSNGQIGFSTYHKFRNGEKIIYITDNQPSVGGISTNSEYYANVKNSDTISLHRNENDALVGINTISLTSYGKGRHHFKSFNKKSVISSINILDAGSGYQNKKVTTGISGINTSINLINVNRHGFNSGEIIRYSTDGSTIGGLVNNSDYYLTRVDDNNFKLSLVGVSTDNSDFYYKTSQFINLTSIGAGTHYFSYQPITVNIVGEVGISSTANNNFKGEIQPIFRGEIVSYHLQNGGRQYGSSEVLNNYREPLLSLRKGFTAELKPIVYDGKITEVLINNRGTNYNSTPDITISGDGFGAVLIPIVNNGKIIEVKVLNGGFGYNQNTTFITATSSGFGSKFKAILQNWTVNLVQKNYNKFTLDDGFIFYNQYTKGNLQYSHLYAPRKLRESIYSNNSLGNPIYGSFDLIKTIDTQEEISSTKHSPILGWAYDGNPIYGPYGYTKKDASDGGSISQIKSGYKLISTSAVPLTRPPISLYPLGFFIEDYLYVDDTDETVLDRNNGRFCVTPEFPNGVYAYFTTLELSAAPDGPFKNYKSPAFPYFIGNNFKSIPNEFNFKVSSNQDDIDLNQTNWIRNTSLYNLLDEKSLYPYINTPNKLNQTVSIKYSSPGYVENVGIVTGGNNYVIGDIIDASDDFIGNPLSGGFGFSATVSSLEGKKIQSIDLQNIIEYDVEVSPSSSKGGVLELTSDSPHSFNSGDVVSISGINTALPVLTDFYVVGVSSNTLAIRNSNGLASTSVTGIVTYVSVSGNLSKVRENDIYSVGTEKIKVLNVDTSSSRLRILRSVNDSVGSSHSYSDIMYENSRKISIFTNIEYPLNYKNKEIYFNPEDSLGLGVGIGTTVFISNPGVGPTSIFIPTKTIYLPKHGLNTGDELIYSTNGGTSIGISTNGSGIGAVLQSTVYVAKISDDLIGISTFRVGLGSTGTFVGIASTNRNKNSTLFLMYYGDGNNHSFKTNYDSLKVNVLKNKVTVSTAETHGLLDNDTVIVDVKSGISTTIKVAYNDYHKKMVINPLSFYPVGVNTIKNSITIENHGFTTGQQVIHNSASVVLPNDKVYYVVVIDKNTLNLSNSYFDSIQPNPSIVGISSAFEGTLSSVNPLIPLYRDSTVFFDVADSTLSYFNSDTQYSAFKLNFYVDSNFTNLFESSRKERLFDIKRNGIIGITSGANIRLSLNEDYPEKLFYRLEPIYNNLIPETKSKISIDSTVKFNNQIQIKNSLYNGKYNIISTSSTTFSYSVKNTPESSYYDQTNSILKYETDSKNAYGSISKAKITSRGSNYYFPPKFNKVISKTGTGALLSNSSKNIGKIKKIKLDNIGYDFSSDFTIRPNLSLPQIVKIGTLASLDSIKVKSIGNGYLYPPNLIVLDGITKEKMQEVDLRYRFEDTFVKILTNTYGINNVDPIIIPTENSNGVGISSMYYDSVTNNVTVTLSVGFSTANTFPFEINDKVMIENISVGLNSTGKGFDSKNYNYKLFTIIGVSENLGGIGIVTYSLNGLLNPGEVPGAFNSTNSFGRIIPEKYFPKFEVILKKNDFVRGESVNYLGENKILGIVQGIDKGNDYVRISSKDYLKPGKIIEGKTSKTRGLISSVISPDAFINLSAFSKFEKGWETQVGFLNNNTERIQDSFYYQNFSYSLKSKVPYQTWEDAVGSLNHTLGFKKFSDYQCEPSLDEVKNNSLFSSGYSGISTFMASSTYVDISTDIIGVANINCVYDFDIARENYFINDNSEVSSNEVYFQGKVLTDYFESLGNRVLYIDDFSNSFYNLPRTSRYVDVHKFNTSNIQSQKYITFVKDRRYIGQRQLMLLTLLHDNNVGYLNQYGRVESSYDLGSFDFAIEKTEISTEGVLRFYPNKSLWNDYDVTTLCYNVKDSFIGIASTNFGNVVYVDSKKTQVSSGTTTIIGVGVTFSSIKAIVEITADNGQYEFNEFSLVHDGTNLEFIDYGQLITDSQNSSPLSNLGEFDAYISGSNINVDFTPIAGIAVTVSSVQISIANTSSSGVGTYYMQYSKIEGRSTSISSSSTPTYNVIGEYSNFYNGGYFIVQATDKTNNICQLSEVIVINDLTNSYHTEYAIINTSGDSIGIGSISSVKNENSTTQLLFIPNPDIDVDVKVYSNSMKEYKDAGKQSTFIDETLVNDYKIYYGAAIDIKRTFDLNHDSYPIFKRYFDGSSSNIVDLDRDFITIDNHFYVTGEKLTYSSGLITEINSPIGIKTTDFGVGIGTTDKLPETVYVVKLDQNRFKLAKSAENALKFNPETLDITSVGVGNSHSFTSTNQNGKALITIDNVIQTPIISTATTSILVKENLLTDDVIYVSNPTNIFSGDLIKIDDEIMRIDAVGVGSTNAIRVNRSWLGTELEEHSPSTKLVKLDGNYNIVGNQIHFVTAPYGRVPLGTPTNPPDERDWENINTNSTFYGRTFMRTADVNTSEEPYFKNFVFDDISHQFNGTTNTFALSSNGQNTSNIDSSIILINDIFQQPGLDASFVIEEETVGISSIRFVGTGTSLSSDINTSSLPAGGIIVSVGSTSGFGYQPLVSAGGTAVVSAAGTISSISIGNSGSGYRTKIETLYGISDVTVRVAVSTSLIDEKSVYFIGTAIVSNGSIVSVAITNPGVGYTSSNPPSVIFDSPLSYSDIPLIYSKSSSGVGTQATIDIVVGQGSSVVDFEIKNLGYGYKSGDILTISANSLTGIKTTSDFSEFQVEVQRTFTDKFAGWYLGEFQVLDSFDFLFDEKRSIFPLKYQGQLLSILPGKGSNINIRDNLLVFINEVLQVPGKSYIFDGGSSITFTQAPRNGDSCKVLFYRGSGDIDVPFRDILETVKIGDELIITYDPYNGQRPSLLENPRTVMDIKSIDVTETNPYFGPGNTASDKLSRPIMWCKQMSDKIINQKVIGKDRSLYSALVYPSTYVINSVGVGSTVIFVESVRPFFNPSNENVTSLEFQKNIYIVSQDTIVSAAATAVVSDFGTISSIELSNGGSGYENAPTVKISNPVGFGTTLGIGNTAVVTSSVILGIVTSFDIVNSGSGYTFSNPPLVLIEPAKPKLEKTKILSYSGDFGIIVGVGTTVIGIGSTGIVFDFLIPINSPLRNNSITGLTTISGIKTDYYFTVSNSNVGEGFTSLNSNEEVIGIGNSFLDGVYGAFDVKIIQSSITGIGLTYIARVTSKVSKLNNQIGVGIGSTGYYGNFSWGMVVLEGRGKENSYNAYTLNGYSGISTGTILTRERSLRTSEYKI